MKCLFVLLLVLSSCAAPRVLVKDCRDAGPDLKNCELLHNI